jgi:hypothetical protein
LQPSFSKRNKNHFHLNSSLFFVFQDVGGGEPDGSDHAHQGQQNHSHRRGDEQQQHQGGGQQQHQGGGQQQHQGGGQQQQSGGQQQSGDRKEIELFLCYF